MCSSDLTEGTYYLEVTNTRPGRLDFDFSISLNDIVYGCLNDDAINYNPDANVGDGSCEFNDCNKEYYNTNYGDMVLDCDGNCLNDEDNDGICDEVDECVGTVDVCGVCNGPGITEGCDSDGIVLDACGYWGGEMFTSEVFESFFFDFGYFYFRVIFNYLLFLFLFSLCQKLLIVYRQVELIVFFCYFLFFHLTL